LVRALTEAAQTRLTYIAGIRDDLLPTKYQEAPDADVTDALESMMEAGLSYRANATVLRTSDRMIGSLIDRSG